MFRRLSIAALFALAAVSYTPVARATGQSDGQQGGCRGQDAWACNVQCGHDGGQGGHDGGQGGGQGGHDGQSGHDGGQGGQGENGGCGNGNPNGQPVSP
jgi:hypothetical protein